MYRFLRVGVVVLAIACLPPTCGCSSGRATAEGGSGAEAKPAPAGGNPSLYLEEQLARIKLPLELPGEDLMRTWGGDSNYGAYLLPWRHVRGSEANYRIRLQVGSNFYQLTADDAADIIRHCDALREADIKDPDAAIKFREVYATWRDKDGDTVQFKRTSRGAYLLVRTFDGKSRVEEWKPCDLEAFEGAIRQALAAQEKFKSIPPSAKW